MPRRRSPETPIVGMTFEHGPRRVSSSSEGSGSRQRRGDCQTQRPPARWPRRPATERYRIIDRDRERRRRWRRSRRASALRATSHRATAVRGRFAAAGIPCRRGSLASSTSTVGANCADRSASPIDRNRDRGWALVAGTLTRNASRGGVEAVDDLGGSTPRRIRFANGAALSWSAPAYAPSLSTCPVRIRTMSCAARSSPRRRAHATGTAPAADAGSSPMPSAADDRARHSAIASSAGTVENGASRGCNLGSRFFTTAAPPILIASRSFARGTVYQVGLGRGRARERCGARCLHDGEPRQAIDPAEARAPREKPLREGARVAEVAAGSTTQSGHAAPRCSSRRTRADFWPSKRYGFTELIYASASGFHRRTVTRHRPDPHRHVLKDGA